MPTDQLTIEHDLNAGDLAPGHRLHSVLGAALKPRLGVSSGEFDGGPLWNAPHFALDNVTLFQDASDDAKAAILSACCHGIMEEAYYIEKCGMYFACKMSLLARNNQERMVYSLFAAEEATHFRWISDFMDVERLGDYRTQPFLCLLNDLLEKLDRNTLTYLIQIILEGWGLHHYRSLHDSCAQPDFRRVLKSILADEARHHASGVVLFEDRQLDSGQLDTIVEVLKSFFGMVQAGPQGVAAAILSVTGEVTPGDRLRLFEELEAESQSEARLRVLIRLVDSTTHSQKILGRLTHHGCLTPLSSAKCAELSARA